VIVITDKQAEARRIAANFAKLAGVGAQGLMLPFGSCALSHVGREFLLPLPHGVP
jgi:hypothetical protein